MLNYQFEVLENRLLLAASVATKGGNLVIKGGGDDLISLTGTGVAGEVEVGVDADGSGVIEADEITLHTGIQGLKINLGKGTDTLIIDGLNLTGNVTINAGAGDDSLLIGVNAPNSFGGKFQVGLGGGGDAVAVKDTEFDGSLHIKGGKGDNSVVDLGGNTGLSSGKVSGVDAGDIDDLPQFAPIAIDDEYSVNENATLTGTLGTSLFANDLDLNDDPLSIVQVNGDVAKVGTAVVLTHGTLTVHANGSFTFVPSEELPPGQSVQQTFEYTLSDGADTDTATVTITINGANDAPVAVDRAVPVAEDAQNVALGITAPTDADLQALTVTVTGLPTSGTVTLADGTTAVTNGQTLTIAQLTGLLYDSVADFTGSAGTFTYQVSDGTATDVGTVTLTVNAANDAPVVDSNSLTVDEDSTNTSLGLSAPTDVDTSDTLTITVTGLPTSGTVTLANGTAVTNGKTLTAAELALQYDAAADFNGDAGDFTYSVNDGTTTVNGTVDITVDPVNDDPVVDSNSLTVDEDSTNTSLGLSAPTDVDTSDTLTITVTGLPTFGTVTLANGTAVTNGQTLTAAELTGLQYDAAANFTGDAGDFTYSVNDGTTTVNGTVDITVDPVNDPPVAEDDTFSLQFTAGASSTQNGNLFNDNGNGADSDVDAADTFTITAVTDTAGTPLTPTGGEFTFNVNIPGDGGDGLIVVTINATTGAISFAYDGNGDPLDATGALSFTYVINDGDASSAAATVNLSAALQV